MHGFKAIYGGASSKTGITLLRMLKIFAGLATILAIIRIDSVMAVYIADRQLNIRVRMELGATRRQIFNMVVGCDMILISCWQSDRDWRYCSALLSPVLSRFLQGVSRVDPLIMAAVPVGLAIAAFAACSLPVFKAANIHPYQVLRK